MKNTIALFALALSTSLFAGNNLKGPKGKNFKAWEKTEQAQKAVTTIEENQNGPIVKNNPVWTLETLASVEVTDSERTILSGPEAKNYKPWNAKKSSDLNTDFLASK